MDFIKHYTAKIKQLERWTLQRRRSTRIRCHKLARNFRYRQCFLGFLRRMLIGRVELVLEIFPLGFRVRLGPGINCLQLLLLLEPAFEYAPQRSTALLHMFLHRREVQIICRTPFPMAAGAMPMMFSMCR